MGDIVLGRVVRAVERFSGDQRLSDAPTRTSRWVPWPAELSSLEPADAEQAGRSLVDLDVRVGPYRFLRPELSIESLEELAIALFRNYLADPRLAIECRPDAVRFHWADPDERGPAFHALLDGMAKRLTELARVEVGEWSVERTPLTRSLVGRL